MDQGDQTEKAEVKMGKTYLGDSVYADVEHGLLKLTTENGLPTDPSNSIYLEPEVVEALINFFLPCQPRYKDLVPTSKE